MVLRVDFFPLNGAVPVAARWPPILKEVKEELGTLVKIIKIDAEQNLPPCQLAG